MAVGTVAAAIVSRSLRGVLFEVSPADPLTYAAVLVLFAATAHTALIVPARRALRVDPLTALRADCCGREKRTVSPTSPGAWVRAANQFSMCSARDYVPLDRRPHRVVVWTARLHTAGGCPRAVLSATRYSGAMDGVL